MKDIILLNNGIDRSNRIWPNTQIAEIFSVDRIYGTMCGEPKREINLLDYSHYINNIRINFDTGTVVGDIIIMGTRKGEVLQALLDNKVEMIPNLCYMATVNNTPNGITLDDIELISIDLIPSTNDIM